MPSLRRHVHEFADVAAMNEFLKIGGFLEDGMTYLTTAGGVGTVFRLQGVDDDGADQETRERYVDHFRTALAPFDERFHVSQYYSKQRVPRFTPGPCAHPVAAQAIQYRTDALNERRDSADSLYIYDLHVVVEIEGPKPRRTTNRSREKEIHFINAELDLAHKRLDHAARGFASALKGGISATRLHKQEAFQFLQRLVNFDPMSRVGVTVDDDHLDYQLGNSHVRYERDHLLVNDQTVKLLTLKGAGKKSVAHLLELWKIPGDFIACLYSHRRSTEKIRTGLWWLNNYFAIKKVGFGRLSAEQSQQDIEELVTDMERHGVTVHDASFTLLLYDRDPTAVDDAAMTAVKVFADHDAVLVEEHKGAGCAWLAMVPGNHHINVRAPWMRLTDRNIADLSFIFATDQGSSWCAHLRAPYLVALETPSHTPFFLTLHHRDVGHWLMTGDTGSGKTTVAALVLMHSQQYDPFTVIFDVVGRYRPIAKALGGSYVELGLNPDVKINPFSLPPTPENLHFLMGFMRVLLQDKGVALNEREEQEVYRQIETVYALPERMRRMSEMILPRQLRGRFANWIEGGRYPLFDNVEDTFALAPFQVLDLRAMSEVKEVLDPLLYYALHRVRGHIGRGLMQIVMDEVWLTIKHPIVRDYVQAGIKAGRNDNVAFMLITQHMTDFATSGLLPDVLQACQTKVFLSQKVDRALYAEKLQLNDRELDRISRLKPKQQIYLKREGHPGVSTVLDVNIDRREADLYINDEHVRIQ
jgi:type IV secretory pathway VirB4 component